MTAFQSPLIGIAAPLHPGGLADNIDTDTIIPSREMRSTGRSGLAEGLFAPWRYTDNDNRIPNPEFVLNRPQFRGASILVAGVNFGCGSSREHAVWALAEFGVKVILAKSFAPIFHANCLRNFLLPITLPASALEQIAGAEIAIDLAAQTVSATDACFRFEIDAEAKQMLTDGLDAIDLTLNQDEAIENWMTADRAQRPWIYLRNTQ